MTRISRTDLNFEREPMTTPFGFKGGFISEAWQSVARLSSEDGRSAVGLGVQGVLWSDSDVFSSGSEAAGNAAMLLLTSSALHEVRRIEFTSPIDLLDAILPIVHARGREITGRARLRKTFALNALVPVDCAAWRLAAMSGSSFQNLTPDFARPALQSRQHSVVSVPAVGYGMAVEEVRALVDDGFFVLKVKVGSDPQQDGDQEKMLAWDCDRMSGIHAAVESARPAGSPTKRVLYYLDANGRYDGIDRVYRLLDHLSAIGALDRTILLEEPFAEQNRTEVGDLPIRVVADESAHTDSDVIDRIDLGYGAIALKPAAKTLSMSFRMAAAAYDRRVPCFCADLTVNPSLVDWNKIFAAHLEPLPDLGLTILETNGFQNYGNWKKMVAWHAYPEAGWIWPREGLFHLDDSFFSSSGGMFAALPHYEALVRA